MTLQESSKEIGKVLQKNAKKAKKAKFEHLVILILIAVS